MYSVIIPTAGLGSRLHPYTKDFNKSLLPYKHKPIISHIIENFDQDTEFIIPLGFCGQQVENFLKLTYTNHKFQFIQIDDYTSKKSGPGYTISQCKHIINSPFYYIPCDTYFNEKLSFFDEDTIFYKKVSDDLSDQYTMLLLDNDRLVQYIFKQIQLYPWVAFTGVMFVKNFRDFFERLDHNEIVFTIQKDTVCKELKSWIDFGNLQIYQNAFTENNVYDFTKTNEYTYICNSKVIKYWDNPNVAEKKFIKYSFNPGIYPNNVVFKGNWLAYEYFEGQVIYQNYSLEIFQKMLNWLENKVWLPSHKDIKKDCLLFYRDKTNERVNKFIRKYPTIARATTVNNVSVKNWDFYYKSINWDNLAVNSIPRFIHGDLQFDNIVFDGENFKIIDWRHEFGEQIEIGDLYYDFAKMLGGFIIDYSQIKMNKFQFSIDESAVTLTLPTIIDNQIYIENLKQFITSKGYSWYKVKQLVPIIFWNMSPLHSYPFDLLLWYLGILLFEENL
jgi:choline kinase/thiamine kinase-like enzyme